MSLLRVQNLPGPGGAGRVLLAWDMSVPEAFCEATDSVGLPPEQKVIVAGTGRCALHFDAPDPCPFGERMPPECVHPVVTRPDADGLVRCTTCGHDSVLVPDNLRRFATSGPAAPQAPDESLTVDVFPESFDDHSAAMTPDALL